MTSRRAGAAVLVFRSNVPAIAEFCFKYVDADFVAPREGGRPRDHRGRRDYGQGSSREAGRDGADVPPRRPRRHRQSFARIHRTNLINWGVVPLVFDDPRPGPASSATTACACRGPRRAGGGRAPARREPRTARRSPRSCVLTSRESEILLNGGILAHTRPGARDCGARLEMNGRRT